MLARLWSRINQDDIPYHYRAYPVWRCETRLYHCCPHYVNPNCCRYWYADSFGPYDACEFITPEAYSARGGRWDQLVSLTLPAPSEISASSRASVMMTACQRTFIRLGRSAIRTARVYYFGREAVEIREREANVLAKRREMGEKEEFVMRLIAVRYLGAGLWRDDLEADGEGEDGDENEHDIYSLNGRGSCGLAVLNEGRIAAPVVNRDTAQGRARMLGTDGWPGKRKRGE